MGDIEGRNKKNFPRLPPAENILCTALEDTTAIKPDKQQTHNEYCKGNLSERRTVFEVSNDISRGRGLK